MIEKLLKRRSYVAVLFMIISLASFYPARFAGLIYDFIGWQRAYDAGSWTDILNCFGYQAHHQVLHFFFYTAYQLFDTNAILWYLLFSLMHGVNSYLLYLFLNHLLKEVGVDKTLLLSFLGALVFALHPLNVEVVVWKACIHYLLSVGFLLGICLLYLSDLRNPLPKKRYAIYGLYAISLFTLELSFVFPILAGLLILFMSLARKDWSILFKGLKQIVAPLFGLLFLYLILNKLTLESWVGHYGEDVHLNFNPLAIVANEFKYLVKHLFLLRYAPHSTKALIFDSMNIPFVSFHLMLVGMVILIIWLFRAKKISAHLNLAFLGLFGFFVSILPIANIYFYFLLWSPNDRYGYVASIFLIIMIIGLLIYLPKWLRIVVLSAFLILNVYIQQKLINNWKVSEEVYMSLAEDFRWYDDDNVIILNLPDNYKGIFMYSIINEPTGLKEVLEYRLRKKYDGNMYDGLMYNLHTKDDGVKVEQTGPSQLKIEFTQWGNWWWRNGIGASNYENEIFKVTNNGHHYLLDLKVPHEDFTFIYQLGSKWKEFEME